MSGVAPGLSTAVAREIGHRLAVLDLVAAGARPAPVDLARVRAELDTLITMWRRLLQAHHPADGQRRCPRCHTWWGSRRRWPCDVWRSAHTSLVRCQEPVPGTVAAALRWAPDLHPARPLGVRVLPLSRQSPAGRSAARSSPAGGTSGAAALGRSSPAGAAVPGTSRGPRHARPEPTALPVLTSRDVCAGRGSDRGQ
ncbi:MAG: hypothetical protein ACRDRV_17560 [Pseudonocardiaceae bacterium]